MIAVHSDTRPGSDGRGSQATYGMFPDCAIGKIGLVLLVKLTCKHLYRSSWNARLCDGTVDFDIHVELARGAVHFATAAQGGAAQRVAA